MDYEELITKVQEHGEEVEFYGPQSDADIRTLEHALDVTLPPSFVAFLRRYGGGGVVGEWISGIFDHKPLLTNEGTVYGDTARCRERFQLPKHLVVIYAQEGEVVWCLDTSRANEGGENPVVSFDVFGKQGLVKIADSFDDFLREYLELRSRDA